MMVNTTTVSVRCTKGIAHDALPATSTASAVNTRSRSNGPIGRRRVDQPITAIDA